MKKYTIAVAGTGYVGLSLAVLLAQHNKVYAVDIVPEKVELINNRKSPIQDEYIEKYLAEKELDLTATLDAESAYSNADFVVIAAPTNYDSVTQHFNTTAVEKVIELVMKANPSAVMVIKSTVPVGYTISKKYHADVEIINYSNFGQRSYYANWDVFPKPSVQKNNLKAIAHYDAINAMRGDYQSFASKYFNLSGPVIKRYSGLEKIDKRYDIVIAGGDQVWNVRCRDADKAYFLSFVKNAKKVAYSPSLGARNINKFALRPQQYAALIKDFDFLSVREDIVEKFHI